MSDCTNGDYTNGDYTKSGYTKTGKKVKCINSGRIDLIYKKVYDVFVGVSGDEFVIDESGDKRSERFEFPCWIEVFDDANLENQTTKSESVVVSKFKVGDTVRVTSTKYISQYDGSIKVGDIGVITSVDNDEVLAYQFRNWWFPEADLELVSDGKVETTTGYNPLTVQQSGNHYKNGKIQPIEYSERNNLSMCQGNIVKYITRHKDKNGVDDLAKVVHYALLEALFVYGKDGVNELRDKVIELIALDVNNE